MSPALLSLAMLLAAQAPAPSGVTVAENAGLPWLALDPDGGLYVVFYRNGNVELSISTDSGKTFSPPVTALDAAKKAGVPFPRRGPRIAVDRQKRIFVSAPLALDPKNPMTNDLYWTLSADQGRTFSKPQRINETPGAAAESLHATAVGPSGDLHAAWLETGKKGQDLYYVKLGDPSAKKGPRTLRLALNVCERCAPAIAVDAKGNPVLLYREGWQEKKSRQIQFLPSAQPTAKPLQVNAVDTHLINCPEDPPSVSVSADGKTVAAAWMDIRDLDTDCNVYLAFSQGGKFARESRVNDDARYYQGHPSVALDAQGVAWTAWEDGRHGVQRIYAANSKTETNLSVTGPKDQKGAAPCVAAQGAFVGVVFELGPHVAFRALSP